MTRDKLIASLAKLSEKLDEDTLTIREVKALYFGLNLDYIKFCEVMRNGNYYPSKSCDARMKGCIDDSAYDEALSIVRSRMNEIVNSIK